MLKTSLVFFGVASVCWGFTLGSCISFFITIVLITIVIVLWLDEIPFSLPLLSDFQRSVVVASSVVANAGVPPELVDSASVEDDERVVHFVIVADVGSDGSPHEFPVGISAKSGHLCGFSHCHDETRHR